MAVVGSTKKKKVFFSKKQKAHMKERRKKKKTFQQKNNKDTGGASSIVKSEEQNQLEAFENETNMSDNNNNENALRKRSRDETSNNNNNDNDDDDEQQTKKQQPQPPQKLRTRVLNGKLQVAQPSNLTSKEAKKFRKDARRQLRQQQQQKNKNKHDDNNDDDNDDDDGMEIEFVSEQEMPVKKSTKSFPSIKELLEQKRQHEITTKEETKRQQKLDKIPDHEKQKYIALDCEMVGIGSDGKKSALARVSMVDWNLNVVLDTFVQVPMKVTDFRTHVSGIEPKHIRARDNKNALMEVKQCRDAVAAILKDKILVGHALSNDLNALMLSHTKSRIRDTAKYRPFQRYGNNKWRARKLRDLVKENLSAITKKYEGFQEGEHDSVHDARATMELFQLVRNQWEKELLQAGSGKTAAAK